MIGNTPLQRGHMTLCPRPATGIPSTEYDANPSRTVPPWLVVSPSRMNGCMLFDICQKRKLSLAGWTLSRMALNCARRCRLSNGSALASVEVYSLVVRCLPLDRLAFFSAASTFSKLPLPVVPAHARSSRPRPAPIRPRPDGRFAVDRPGQALHHRPDPGTHPARARPPGKGRKARLRGQLSVG